MSGGQMAGLAARMAGLAAAMLLSACVLPGGFGGAGAKGPNPVTGGEITVTALDAPAEAAAPAPVATEVEAAAAPMAEPEAAPLSGEEIAPVDAPPLAEPVPEVQKTPGQIACEKKKGQWSRTGGGGHSCVFRTKDAGKQCSREGDCQGACLARSGSCAPHQPLFGCNEILDSMGRRMTLCID